jgi:hypothetical protein
MTAAAVLAVALAGPGPAPARRGDSGFWPGTDSSGIAVRGRAPYRMPVIGGRYGGYVGMIGNWAAWQHCGGGLTWSGADSRAANRNLSRYRAGIGTGGYWFMAGPGVDPRYDGTVAQARRWGREQAARAVRDLRRPPGRVTYPVLFMDIEIPGAAPHFTPAPDNGWNDIYDGPCSGRVKARYIAPRVDRADVSGFAAYLAAHSRYRAGIYSAPGTWRFIFGKGRPAALRRVYEWTYAPVTASLRRKPAGWCLAGTRTCARFFGGITAASRYAVMWQWSGGGGTRNGYGDFDQVDAARTPR